MTKAGAEAPVVRLYHRVDDPWSHLLLQVLPPLLETYDVALECITVPLPPAEHFPRPDLVMRHALRDAQDLSRHCHLDFATTGLQPAIKLVDLANARLLQAQDDPNEYLALARALGEALFRGDAARVHALCETDVPPPPGGPAIERLRANQRHQLEAGHYNSGMLSFAGNWYWGVDRIAHLERDLVAAGRRRPGGCVDVLQRRPAREATAGVAAVRGPGPLEVEFFCSFRSPYAYVAAARTFELQRRYAVRIRPRLIVPMKMAGFVIPDIKVRYFRMDPAREALLHGVRFGNFCDPFGPGLERAMSLVDYAEAEGRLEPYILSVMQGVWADGIDTATDDGLRHLAERAGLDWRKARPHLGQDAWRVWAAEHRQELERMHQYAAPTYRVDGWITWGQDRLWMLEREIRARLGLEPLS